MAKKNKNNVVYLRNNFSLPATPQEFTDRLAVMKSVYLETLAVNILDTVLQQSSAVGLAPATDDSSLLDIALVKESIMSMLARAAGCSHKLQEFAEKNFEYEFDENDVLQTNMREEPIDKGKKV